MPATASAAEPAERTGAALAVPVYTDAAQLRGAAQAIIDAFHARTVAAGDDPGASFDAHYMELGQDPLRYSFYQYRFVLDPLRERSRLELDTILAVLASKR